MAEYKVAWVIEIDADSPQEAASAAKEIQLDPDSEANHFIVTDKDGNHLNLLLVSIDDQKQIH
jgi:hypothetical protein